MSQEAVLFVRSATNDDSGAHSLSAQEQAGHDYASRNGLAIARTWAVKGRTPLEGRRAFRDFVKYVKASPRVKVLLFERPDRISRQVRDLVMIHDLGQECGKEVRFFGAGHESDGSLMFFMTAALARYELESPRAARKNSIVARREPGSE